MVYWYSADVKTNIKRIFFELLSKCYKAFKESNVKLVTQHKYTSWLH